MTHMGCKSFGRRHFLWAGWWPWVRRPGSRPSSVTDFTGRPWTSQFPSWACIPLVAMKDETRRLQSSFLKAYKMACWQKQSERATWKGNTCLKILASLSFAHYFLAVIGPQRREGQEDSKSYKAPRHDLSKRKFKTLHCTIVLCSPRM